MNTETVYDTLLDTGASIHVVCDRKFFTKLDTNMNFETSFLEMADGNKSSDIIKGRGTAKIPITDVLGHRYYIILTEALYVPNFKKNIVSVKRAIKKGYRFYLNDLDRETMISPRGNIFKISSKSTDLYYINNFETNSVITRSMIDWHRLLGHQQVTEVNKLPAFADNMKIVKSKKFPPCEICIKSHLVKNVSKKPDERGNKPFDKIHIDLNGPINEINIIDAKYIFGAVDDYSQFLTVYIMESKVESPNILKFYLAQIAPYGHPSIVRTDNGTEFTSKEFNNILIDKGIKHEYSAPYNPHMMGHIERQWRTIFNCTRALLFESNIPNLLWPYAVKYATFLRNRSYQKRIKCTPLQCATNRKPDMAKVHFFGSKCYIKDLSSTKLEPKALEGVFIGYDEQSPSMLIFDPVSHEVKKSVNVKVLNSPFYKNSPNIDRDFLLLPDEINTDSQGEDEQEIESQIQTPETLPTQNHNPKYNLRDRKVVSYEENFCNLPANNTSAANSMESVNPHFFYNPEQHLMSLEDYYIGDKHFKVCANMNHTSIVIPNTFKQAMASGERVQWWAAMNEEIESLIKKKTWKLVKIPLDRDIIGGRWVFSVKLDPTGNVKFKARFVAQGFTQIPGINFAETYAPTPSMTSIRMFINIVVQEALLCHHCDVNSAYLNADIDFDDIYISQPPGFASDPTLCCHLNKAIYGLKQAAHRWHATIVSFMTSQGLVQGVMDPCVFVRRNRTSTLIILIWVDDLIIAASSEQVMNHFKQNFANAFAIKDLGILNWFLGIQFKFSDNMISMNQSFYVQQILDKFNMSEAQPRSLPCDPSIYDLLRLPSQPLENPTLYRELLGSLIYLMTCTRPDLAFIVTLLSRFMQNPTQRHFKLAKNVLQYLKGTKQYDLKYFRTAEFLKLLGYTDSDWGSDIDFQSVSGHVFSLNPPSALIAWRSGKQSLVAGSSCEAEYIALYHACSEAVYLRQLLAEFLKAPLQTVMIFGDNIGSIQLAKHPAYKRKSRHISLKYHFVRRYVANKSIALAYIPSRDNMADMATKPIKGPNMKSFARIRGSDPKLRKKT